ncbi:MAG: hypothetical protein QXF12_00295 [Candidatus Aenigmatarchaeota archaeon]
MNIININLPNLSDITNKIEEEHLEEKKHNYDLQNTREHILEDKEIIKEHDCITILQYKKYYIS